MSDRTGEARVTVVIPVWDEYADRKLVEAVISVTQQDLPVELIVVDNASRVPLPPLGAVEVIRLEQRRTTGAARNAALERLRTPYVVFLDADDLLLEGALSALVDGLDARADRSAYTLSIVHGATGQSHRSPRRLARALSGLPRLFAPANTIWSLLPTQGATIMRAADVRSCGGYADSDHGEDWVLATSLAFRGSVGFERRPGLVYRLHEDSPGVRALSSTTLLDNARQVRTRVREDPAIPAYMHFVLPLMAVAQWGAARIAHPLYRSCRAALTRRR